MHSYLALLGTHTQVIQTVVFLLLVLTYSTITEIPWSVYSTFVLEEKHGFNKQVGRTAGANSSTFHAESAYNLVSCLTLF